jgi:hypothetical protein
LKYNERRHENSLMVKLSCNIQYSSYFAKMGSIDARNKEIQLLNLTAKDSFYIPNSSSYKGSYLVPTDNLFIFYGQRVLSAIPQIGLSNKTVDKYFYWEVDLSWQVPLYQAAGLLVNYQNTQGDAWHHWWTPEEPVSNKLINANNSSLVMQYKGNPVYSPPFNYSGLIFKVCIGINLANLPRFR